MKVIVQRSQYSKVEINNKLINEIKQGLVLLVGFNINDNDEDIKYMVQKVINLRIFNDENGIMNKSIFDIGGEILSISQFTLYGDTKKGNRPSYIKALKGDEALILYNKFNEQLNKYIKTKSGIFGADMLVSIKNDGPVTIILESKSNIGGTK